MEDTKIIELYWERNEQAILETQMKYEKLCKLIISSILSNPRDVEEVVNETYLGIWNAIPPERPKFFKAFMCKIAKNIATTRLKYINADKRNPEHVVALEELEGILSGTDDIIHNYEAKEIAGYINQYLAGIDKEKRIMFVRRYWFCDSITDIARIMGLSDSKVKTTLFRVRKDLKRYLEGKGVEL